MGEVCVVDGVGVVVRWPFIVLCRLLGTMFVLSGVLVSVGGNLGRGGGWVAVCYRVALRCVNCLYVCLNLTRLNEH